MGILSPPPANPPQGKLVPGVTGQGLLLLFCADPSDVPLQPWSLASAVTWWRGCWSWPSRGRPMVPLGVSSGVWAGDFSPEAPGWSAPVSQGDSPLVPQWPLQTLSQPGGGCSVGKKQWPGSAWSPCPPVSLRGCLVAPAQGPNSRSSPLPSSVQPPWGIVRPCTQHCPSSLPQGPAQDSWALCPRGHLETLPCPPFSGIVPVARHLREVQVPILHVT